MANEQKPPRAPEPEAARQKKEERARRARRRNRQLIGLALAILIVVGAASIVSSGVTAVQGLLEGAGDESDQYRTMLEPFVWFDVLPFDSLENADQNALKQVAIWSLNRELGDTVERNDFGEALITADRLDEHAMTLFGPGFRFSERATFTDEVQGLTYEYDEATETYVIPNTGLTPPYFAQVAEVVREPGGVRRVVMGYVSSFASVGSNQGIAVPNLDKPAKYMDYMLRREGGKYYLYAVLNNTTHTPAAASTSQPAESEPAESLPPPASSSAPAASSQPASEETLIGGGADSASGSGSGAESRSGPGASSGSG